jgi:hypothetical protein
MMSHDCEVSCPETSATRSALTWEHGYHDD